MTSATTGAAGGQVPLRVGMIGCGFIGRYHASGLRAATRRNDLAVRWVAVCDHDVARAEAFAERGGCSIVTDDAAAVIANPDLDAVYICTETLGHVDLAIAAAQAGKHVFCEKPLARNLVDAEAMTHAVVAAGVVNQVGLVLRFSPVYRVIEDLVRQDDLGELLSVQMRDDQFFPIRGHYASQWRADVERAGGGTLIEHSIHDVDLFLRLFGPVEQVRCHTRMSSYRGIEDVAQVTFGHAGGRVTHLASVWHGLNDRASTRRLEIFFDRGYIASDDDFFGSVTWQGASGEPVRIGPAEVLRRYCALEGLDETVADERWIGSRGDHEFLAAAVARRPTLPDFTTALAAHRVVDACYRSAAQGAAVLAVGGT